MFGILLLKGRARVGILISLDLVMIGWWFAWKVFLAPLQGQRVCRGNEFVGAMSL